MDLLASLRRRQLIVVTGKGGVGKTLTAAVLGTALCRPTQSGASAERGSPGRRVLLIEVDPRENLHQMLGVMPSGGAIVEVPRGQSGGSLALQNLRPRDVVDRIVRERVKLGFIAKRVLASPVYQNFVEGAPGLAEMAVLAHAAMLLRGVTGAWQPNVERDAASRATARFDSVIIDAPATGHGLALLAAPRLVSEAITSGPFGELAGELARFVEDPATTGVVVTTQAEELPVEESLDLRQSLVAQGRLADLLVVNGLYPVPPRGSAEDADDPLMALWRDRRSVQESERARLYAGWPEPAVELPLLPLAPGPELVAALTERLLRAAVSGRAR